MLPAHDKPTGFLDVCANSNYVFALYCQDDYAKTTFSSPYILAYDWSGRKIAVIDTGINVLSITANSGTLFLLTTDAEGEFGVKQIRIESTLDGI